jgi:hypothetical protein
VQRASSLDPDTDTESRDTEVGREGREEHERTKT